MIEPTGRCRLAIEREAAMAGSERSKNLPLAAGSCYEGKGCGGTEHRRCSRKGFSRPRWGTEKKKNCHDHPPLSSLLRNTLGSVRLGSDCGSVGAVMPESKPSILIASREYRGRTESARRDY